ncbi:hypothetical protein J8J20_22775, partial [Mycobacterium tuberculosis]|nr:hypothetical protein [Mycobacterium tuberculosis]
MNNTLSRFAYIDAARATAQSFVDLVRGIDNPDVSLSRRSTWTVADCVGHVASEPARDTRVRVAERRVHAVRV